MKSLILAIASFLTVVLLLTPNAFAAGEGGNVAAGENDHDTFVPDAGGQGLPGSGLPCDACVAHQVYVKRLGDQPKVSPFGSGTDAQPATPTAPAKGRN